MDDNKLKTVRIKYLLIILLSICLCIGFIRTFSNKKLVEVNAENSIDTLLVKYKSNP